MNVLFVNIWNSLSKTDSGASVRTIMMLRALTKIANVDVVSFNTGGSCAIEDANVIFNGSVKQDIKKNESRKDKFFKLFHAKDPYSYYTKNIAAEKIVDSFVKAGEYNLIVVRYFYQACKCGLLKYANRLVIDVDDDPRDALRSQAKVAKSFRNRTFIKLQSFLVQKMVNDLSKKVKFLFYSNPNQAKGGRTAYLHNVSLVSGVTENVNFQQAPMRILFVGNMDYYPNRLGLARFTHSIFPKIIKIIPNVELRVVGKFSDNELMESYNLITGVKCMGYVNDLAKEYADSRVVIAPIYHGAGTSIKVIEAMKMRRPIVSTPIGVRGFESYFEAGRDYLLANNDDEFAKKTIMLLTDCMVNQSVSDFAYENVMNYFSQERFCEIVKESLE